jgi:uncharacterized protein (DUF2267 family)
MTTAATAPALEARLGLEDSTAMTSSPAPPIEPASNRAAAPGALTQVKAAPCHGPTVSASRMEVIMTTGLPVFDKTVQETNLWLKALEEELSPCERHQAYDALRAVLHALRDRVPPEGAMHFAAQLPLLLRGVFTEGWVMSKTPSDERDTTAFGFRVAQELPDHFPVSAERCLRAVFKVIDQQMDKEIVDKVKNQLPARVRALWPEHEASTPT